MNKMIRMTKSKLEQNRDKLTYIVKIFMKWDFNLKSICLNLTHKIILLAKQKVNKCFINYLRFLILLYC